MNRAHEHTRTLTSITNVDICIWF